VGSLGSNLVKRGWSVLFKCHSVSAGSGSPTPIECSILQATAPLRGQINKIGWSHSKNRTEGINRFRFVRWADSSSLLLYAHNPPINAEHHNMIPMYNIISVRWGGGTKCEENNSIYRPKLFYFSFVNASCCLFALIIYSFGNCCIKQLQVLS
jgi:hypothetical protein